MAHTSKLSVEKAVADAIFELRSISEPHAGNLVSKFLSQYANSFTNDPRSFAEAVAREHRTLQQGIFHLVTQIIVEWAKAYKSGQYDLRNELTVKTCAKLLPILEAENVVLDGRAYTPLI